MATELERDAWQALPRIAAYAAGALLTGAAAVYLLNAAVPVPEKMSGAMVGFIVGMTFNVGVVLGLLFVLALRIAMQKLREAAT